MALIDCPGCGKKISEWADICPGCGFSFSPSQSIICEECNGKVNANLKECPYCGFPIRKGMAKPLSQEKPVPLIKQHSKLLCPRCRSVNVSVNVNESIVGYKGNSEIRKKSVITNTANSLGRKGMIAATGGLWLLTPKKSKYKEISKGKVQSNMKSVGSCHNCGYTWIIREIRR